MELAPYRSLSTIGYNGTSPGPLIRVREGKPVTIDVINDTDVPELVHWHGQLIPSEVDGAEEEGTPMIPPHGRHRYQFTPGPAGSRWYHTHTMAGSDLHRGTYTGQYGFFYIDSGKDPGKYDQEHFLALRDWEPFLANEDEDDEDEDPNAPMPEKPARMPPGCQWLRSHLSHRLHQRQVGWAAARRSSEARAAPSVSFPERLRHLQPEDRRKPATNFKCLLWMAIQWRPRNPWTSSPWDPASAWMLSWT